MSLIVPMRGTSLRGAGVGVGVGVGIGVDERLELEKPELDDVVFCTQHRFISGQPAGIPGSLGQLQGAP